MDSLSRLRNLEPLSALLILLINFAIQTQKGEGDRPIVWDIANVPHDGAVGVPGPRMINLALCSVMTKHHVVVCVFILLLLNSQRCIPFIDCQHSQGGATRTLALHSF